MLTQTFYISTATFGPEHPADEDILREAIAHNAGADMTGCLFRTKSHFFQLLEGPEHTLKELLEKIYDDARHHSITKWPVSPCTERSFPDWAMGFEPSDHSDMIAMAFKHAAPRPIHEISQNIRALFADRFKRR